MIKLVKQKNFVDVVLSQCTLRGEYVKKFPWHPDLDEDNILVSTLAEEHNNMNLYEKIEDIPINCLPNDVEFEILNYDYLEKPLSQVPSPFEGVSFVKKNGLFFVRYMCITNIGEWNKKWDETKYFSEFENQTALLGGVKAFYYPNTTGDSGICIIQLEDNKSEYIGDSFENSLPLVNNLIQSVEDSLSGLNEFKKVLDIWRTNKQNSNEDFWQKMLESYSWVIAQCFSSPVILFKDKAYLGGKGINNKSGGIIDFAFKNKLTENLALIEIKTPKTPLIGRKYRGNFSISDELSGSIIQILKYKDVHQKGFYSIIYNSEDNYELFNPKCLLIIGSSTGLSGKERESFELFRQDLKSIEIVTFDELFGKVYNLLNLLRC